MHRKDGDALNVLTESASAQLVLFYSYSGLLSKQTPASKPVLHKYKLVTLPATSVPENCIDQRIGRIFLGLDAKQQAVFAVSVENQAADAVAALKEQVRTGLTSPFKTLCSQTLPGDLPESRAQLACQCTAKAFHAASDSCGSRLQIGKGRCMASDHPYNPAVYS